MRAEDIRRLYRRVTPATDEEFRATDAEVRTDPGMARDFIATTYSLSVEDPSIAVLLRLFLEGMLMRLIQERAATDDAYALECASLIADLMRDTMPPPRGKPRSSVKTA